MKPDRQARAGSARRERAASRAKDGAPVRARFKPGATNELLKERVLDRTAWLAKANEVMRREFKERLLLENEIMEISEQERRSFGHDLHDGVCQHLSGVAMMVHSMASDCARKSLMEEADKLKTLSDLIRVAADQARDVARGLHPVDTDASGLVTALRDLAARHDVPGKVQCRFVCPRPVPVRNHEVALHLYRIAQEAVVNASNHARAQFITVHLSMNGRNLDLSIDDDGAGLPFDHRQSPGLGLRLMRYRADVIGAEFKLESPKGGGTSVSCTLPGFV